MKKIISPISTGGAPLSDDTLESVFNSEIWAPIESLLIGICPSAATGNVGIIISGCVVTGSGPYAVSAGIVYLNGQYMALPAIASTTLPCYIVPASLIQISKTFNDGTSRPLINEQDATFTTSVPGSGQYITLSSSGIIGSATNQLGGMRLENVLSSMKVPVYTPLALLNSFTGGPNPPAYKLESNGRVTIMMQGVTTPASGTVKDFATLPAAIIPKTNQFRTLYDQASNLPLTSNSVGIMSGGTLQLWGTYSFSTIYRAYELTYWLDS